MGTIQHHVAVATFSDTRYAVAAEVFERIKRFARALSNADSPLYTPYENLLVGPVSGVMNGYISYLMVPDGSKEYWPTSDDADTLRRMFVDEMSKVADVFIGSWGEIETTGSRAYDSK